MKVNANRNITFYTAGRSFIELEAGKVTELPDEYKNHWFILGLINDGSLVLQGSEAPEPAPAVKTAPVEGLKEEAPAEEVVDATAEEVKPAGNNKKKK